ncbi:DUF4252 domain-containing protein [Lewinella sp. JB7]|uniref:DUF4252 domain-containing protein n=1 Tax=Lewinella sp. JB7 TaxID=2962887 RepID=UPI0020C9718B|nr:DUF4252 domain-containing protein [Lewinella sp. JB7]MCP9236898.1 DUF4252 domain-containing protein [Lewinella sp. JB7]
MKLLLSLLLLTTVLSAQDDIIKDFIREHRRGEENVALKVPGWMVNLASDIGATASDDPDEQVLFRLLGELGTVRMVTFLNEDFRRPESSVVNLLYSLERYRGFERWAEVRTQEGDRVALTVRYERQKIRELVAVVTEEDRTTLVAARAHLTAEELGRLVNQLEGL